MARSVNTATLLGYLGQDPELRYTGSGTAVCNIRLATNEEWTDNNGNQKSRTEWHTAVAWGKLAEVCAEHLRKGSRVYIEGSLRTNSWTDNDGNERSTKQVRVDEIVFLGEHSSVTSGGQSGGNAKGANQGAGQQGQRQREQQPAGQAASGQTFEPDDELPF